jgi:hypothetical protein
MGQAKSRPTRLTKENRRKREQLKQHALTKRKEAIEKLQSDIIRDIAHDPKTAVVQQNDIVTMLQIGETAKQQLDRGGGGLTKSDLVAIVVALEPTMRDELARLNELTVSDLNTMIRSLVYDPERMRSQSKPVETRFERKSHPIALPANLLQLF